MNQSARILLVEDDVRTANAVKDLFEQRGYAVVVAENRERGLTLGLEETFDVVVTDIQLPGPGGLEPKGGIRLLVRLHAAKPLLPIILMTAYPGADIQSKR